MSMIRTVSYKASIQADGSIYNESIEYGAEVDSMPLAQSQLDDAGARVDQLRQAILAKRRDWEGTPQTPKEQPKEEAKQKPAATITPTSSIIPNDGTIRCIVCRTPVEQKLSRKGVKYSYCPQCRDNRRVDGTEFPPTKGAGQ